MPNITTWYENFAPTGYRKTWSAGETITAGSVVNEDASPAAAMIGVGPQVLSIQVAVANDNAYVAHNFASNPPVAFLKMVVCVTAESLADGQVGNIASVLHSDATSFLWALQLKQIAVGQLQLQHSIWSDATQHTFATNITLNTKHTVELKWNSTADTYQIWTDDVSQASGSLTGAAAGWTFSNLLIGGLGGIVTIPCTIQYAKIAVATDARVRYAPSNGSLCGPRRSMVHPRLAG